VPAVVCCADGSSERVDRSAKKGPLVERGTFCCFQQVSKKLYSQQQEGGRRKRGRRGTKRDDGRSPDPFFYI